MTKATLNFGFWLGSILTFQLVFTPVPAYAGLGCFRALIQNTRALITRSKAAVKRNVTIVRVPKNPDRANAILAALFEKAASDKVQVGLGSAQFDQPQALVHSIALKGYNRERIRANVFGLNSDFATALSELEDAADRLSLGKRDEAEQKLRQLLFNSPSAQSAWRSAFAELRKHPEAEKKQKLFIEMDLRVTASVLIKSDPTGADRMALLTKDFEKDFQQFSDSELKHLLELLHQKMRMLLEKPEYRSVVEASPNLASEMQTQGLSLRVNGKLRSDVFEFNLKKQIAAGPDSTRQIYLVVNEASRKRVDQILSSEPNVEITHLDPNNDTDYSRLLQVLDSPAR